MSLIDEACICGKIRDGVIEKWNPFSPFYPNLRQEIVGRIPTALRNVLSK
jgi:hypothetical protein